MNGPSITRAVSMAVAALLLAAAAHRLTGQGAVAWSNPGQEDLTFWVNHDGLEQIDVEGPLGFGDAARILMRRRANAEALRAQRDRFVFTDRDTSKLPYDRAASYVIGAGRVFNLIDASGHAHRVLEDKPGKVTRKVGGRDIAFDVRPLVRLKVNVARPARVYITGADGLGYAPKGTISRFAALPAEQYFHAAESFSIDLPAGRTTIEATRGIEHTLTSRTIDLREETTIDLETKRWIDMAERGWYSADAHIHANYTAPHHQSVTPGDVLTYTLAEDLHIPNMMVANSSGSFLHDEALFEGRPHRLSQPPYFLYWNEEMRNAGAYGHMCFFGLKALVAPLYTGFRDTPYADDYPPNYVQAKAARAQGGAVSYAHPGYSADIDGFSARELPVDAALGEIDALDVMSNNPEDFAMENWYRLLNTGLRVGISAGTDSFTNVADHYTPGGHRVYAYTGGALRYDRWIEAFKQHRTFATNGPMLFLEVNGNKPGSEIRLPAGRHTIDVSLGFESAVPTSAPELVVNGVARKAASRITLDRSAWIAARVRGPWSRMILNDSYAFAHTSPVWVTIGDEPVRIAEDVEFWNHWIDQLIDRVDKRGKFSTPERKQEVIALFRRAQERYRAVR
ncbi:MAG: CehA/McbA family metallohydrolase [Bryobacteraceae bacterium]